MKSIRLTDKQLNILIQLVNCEQYTVTDDVLNEELNGIKVSEPPRANARQQINAEYQSRHAFTPEYEAGAQDLVERHTPMPPNYPQ